MVLAGLVLALGAATAWDRALLRSARSLRAIEIVGPGAVTLALANGERLSARVEGRRGVNRYWVALPVRSTMRCTILLSADMLETEPFRVIRLWALWDRVPGVASGQLPG